MARPKPNDQCPCESGRKFKKCCRDAAGLLTAALASHQRGESARAARLYEAVTELEPAQAAAWHGLGAIAHEQGQARSATKYLRRAAELKPQSQIIQHAFGVALLRLGNALRESHELDAAADCFAQVPQAANAAEVLEAANNLGVVRQQQGRFAEAAECFAQAAAMNPASVEAHNNLGLAYKALGQVDQARAEFAEALRLNPAHEGAEYQLRILNGEAPAATPASLVASLFDGYADKFDAHLEGELAYRTPALLREVFDEAVGAREQLDILDLGCGTGLAGVAFQELARTLAGADLSQRMLDKARERGIYQILMLADLTTALANTAPMDLILAADVFVYVGDLSPVFEGVRGALRPGGYFLFSVESTQEGMYKLSSAGRFQHSAAYIRSLAYAHGFECVRECGAALRQERGLPVEGNIHLLKSTAPAAS